MSVSVIFNLAPSTKALERAAGATPQAGTLRTGYWTDGITFYYQFSQ